MKSSGILPLLQVLSSTDVESINVQICRILSSLCNARTGTGVGWRGGVTSAGDGATVRPELLARDVGGVAEGGVDEAALLQPARAVQRGEQRSGAG